MTQTARVVRISAPAKVNLILRVLDRRSDGYHNLWSLMQTVALEDELRFQVRADSTELSLKCDEASLPTDRRNLVWRAAALVLDRAGLQVGLYIEITKRIPLAAGLGGGSSDAAATIVALNHLLGLGWSGEEMARVGASLGSDVSFFFFAPSAIVCGRGEDVAAVTLTGARWVVLVHPGFPIETRWAYDRLAVTRERVRPLSETHSRIAGQASLAWEDVIPLMENDFEQPLVPVYGAIREIKTRLLSNGAETALLSGSGATVFGIFRDENSAVSARASVGQVDGWRAYVGRAGTASLSCREEFSDPLQVC
ncbi:MAG TPA: 4-(cytidine 5'-diphospho)-2-C-methyl-D-erythritol kinase [Nitrospiraceae bacterium]|nr:4-(cytidine 5'-diphospho)-2-C-methyl-D-erythritol kinase [Nitrospiraceae bacterium]